MYTCADGTAGLSYYLTSSECAGDAEYTQDYDTSVEYTCAQTAGVVSTTQSISVTCGTADFSMDSGAQMFYCIYALLVSVAFLSIC